MKDQRWKFIAIATFVIVGFAITGYLILLFGEAPKAFTGGTYPLKIHFDRISLITDGTEVLLAGKRIGQVREIRFIDENNLAKGVEVLADVEKKYSVPAGVTAIESVTSVVMGRAIIKIKMSGPTPPSPALRMDGTAIIRGVVEPLLDTILPADTVPALERAIKQIGDLAAALTPVASEIEKLVKSRPIAASEPASASVMANLSTVAQRLDQLLVSMNALIGDPNSQASFRATLANIRKASDDLAVTMADARTSVGEFHTITTDARAGIGEIRTAVSHLDARVDDVGRKAATALDTADRTLTKLGVVADRAADGKGTVGLLLNDSRLYESFVLTVQRLDKTLGELQLSVEQLRRGELKIKIF